MDHMHGGENDQRGDDGGCGDRICRITLKGRLTRHIVAVKFFDQLQKINGSTFVLIQNFSEIILREIIVLAKFLNKLMQILFILHVLPQLIMEISSIVVGIAKVVAEIVTDEDPK